MNTYSFLDVNASIIGPGGYFQLGSGAGADEEGITVSPSQDINDMKIGADGTPMHSLHADKSGHVTVRLLKTSPVNAQLGAMLALQRGSSSLHGNNVILINNPQSGDVITCTLVAFKKWPELRYAKDGGTNEWAFDAGYIDQGLGSGAPTAPGV
jgi:hypothetical protein